jgi:hypothetical protein
VLGFPASLLLLVASQTSNRTTNSTRNAVGNTVAQVRQLAASLLLLAFLVLLSASLLEGLTTNEAANRLLGGAYSLVPAAGGAVRVVGGDTGGGGCDRAGFDGGMGEFVFGVSFGLLVAGFTLLVPIVWLVICMLLN